MSDDTQRLGHLACLRVAGPDRVPFLQGQVSSDVRGLADGRAGLTALNNRQGRAFCTALAVETGESILLVMPTSQVDDTLARLRMFVLRARVELDAPGAELPLAAAWADGGGALPAVPWATGRIGDVTAVRMPGHDPRWLLVGERAGAGDDGRWHYEDVRAALPQVYPATRELFIPQALNLDALRGVSFDKGCYVGQEIIARLHFRGTVKRRMRLLTGDSGIGAAVPGGAVRRGTESIGKIVDAAEWSGRGALLAVCSVDAPADELTLEDGTALGPAPLPYALPDG
jgi:hypothetical protein